MSVFWHLSSDQNNIHTCSDLSKWPCPIFVVTISGHAAPWPQPFSIILVYLLVGITFVMLLLNVVTQVPQLNLAKLFALEPHVTDPERQLLANASTSSPYSRHLDEAEENQYSSQAAASELDKAEKIGEW